MNLIVATDENWGIGNGNKLLTHLSGDLKYFKEKTMGKVVVMGRKTLESLPGGKPLSGRTNIVLTRSLELDPGCKVCHNMEELLAELKKYNTEDVFVVGGAKVYRDLLGLCDKLYITKIMKKFEADAYLDDIDKKPEFKKVWESTAQVEGDTRYVFTQYDRVKE